MLNAGKNDVGCVRSNKIPYIEHIDLYFEGNVTASSNAKNDNVNKIFFWSW